MYSMNSILKLITEIIEMVNRIDKIVRICNKENFR